MQLDQMVGQYHLAVSDIVITKSDFLLATDSANTLKS